MRCNAKVQDPVVLRTAAHLGFEAGLVVDDRSVLCSCNIPDNERNEVSSLTARYRSCDASARHPNLETFQTL